MIILAYALPSRENCEQTLLKLNPETHHPRACFSLPTVVKIDNVWHYLPSQFRSHVAIF